MSICMVIFRINLVVYQARRHAGGVETSCMLPHCCSLAATLNPLEHCALQAKN